MVTFWLEIKSHPKRVLKTAMMGIIFIGLGIFVASPGPALLDLQLLANTTFSKIALLLPVRSLGYAVGSVVGGIVGDRFDHQIVIMTALLISAISMIMFPLFPLIVLMMVFIFVSGVCNGCIDTVVS